MTQAELAERLGYSDKSVSKWERGEGLPDVLCLKSMADLFGVSLDFFLETEHSVPEADEPLSPPVRQEVQYAVNHRNITLLSVAGVWLLAAIVSVAVSLSGKRFPLPFVCAIPISALLLVIFNSLWGRRAWMFPAVSLLCWGILFLVCWILRDRDPWLLMTVGIPATAVVWFSCRVKTKTK